MPFVFRFALCVACWSSATLADLVSDAARLLEHTEGEPRRVLPFRQLGRGERLPLLLPIEILVSSGYPCVQLTILSSPFSQFTVEGEGDWSEPSRLGLIDSVRCGAHRYAWMGAAVVMHSESAFVTGVVRALPSPNLTPATRLLPHRWLGPDQPALEGFVVGEREAGDDSLRLIDEARVAGATSVTSRRVPEVANGYLELEVDSGCHALSVATWLSQSGQLEVEGVSPDPGQLVERSERSRRPRARFCLEQHATVRVRLLARSGESAELVHAEYPYPLTGWSTTPPHAGRHSARALFEHHVRPLTTPPVVSFTALRGTVTSTIALVGGRCYLALTASTSGSLAPLLLAVRTSERTHFDVGARHAALVAFCVGVSERSVRVTTGVEFDSAARVAIFDLGEQG